MTKEEIAEEIKNAFFEGYHSYQTPAAAYNTVDDAWENSDSKQLHDSLVEEHSRDIYE